MDHTDWWVAYFLGVGTVLCALYGTLKWLVPWAIRTAFGWFMDKV